VVSYQSSPPEGSGVNLRLAVLVFWASQRGVA
jgi:hypothetical protein